MSRLFDKQDKLTITNYLRFNRNATFEVEQTDGTLVTLDVAELAGLDDISATELAFLDGVTAGTVTASKALVVDANKDIATIRHLTISGNLVTGSTTLSEAELGVLDAVTAGTGAVSKALVLDANGDVNMPDGGSFNVSADTLAAAGTTSADAAALADQITVVTGADGAAGVVLPAAADLGEFTVTNDSSCYAVKVYPVDSGDDVINDLQSDEPFILAPRQTATFKAISATQWYAGKAAGLPTTETHFEIFDDFTYATFDETDNWISFEGAGATAAAVVTAPEGKLDMVSGGNGDATDGTSLSLILLAKGSLVSLGTTVMEARVSGAVLTGCNVCVGLSDTLAESNEHGLYRAAAGTVSDGGLTLTNAAAFVFDKDATDATNWLVVSENAGTISNSGAEESASVGPTADTYQTLRIEVDASGDARFYIDGVLEKTEATAVATTSLLIPFISVDEAGTSAAETLSIDYVKFQGARPSSNA